MLRGLDDLNIESEIIPLFDFTNNIHSREALRGIFLDSMDSLDAVIDRQQIIKGYIANWDVLRLFSYSGADFNEVYSFLRQFSGSQVLRAENMLQLRLWEIVSGEIVQQQKSRLCQAILFLNDLHEKFLSKIRTDFYPENYRPDITTMTTFINSLDIDKHATEIRSGKLAGRAILALTSKLGRLSASGILQNFWNSFFRFEAYLSITAGIQKQGFRFPEFTGTGISIKGFYHPLVRDPVQNDIVSDGNVILITGPNMSGKSTLLKAVGLCIYLGHQGLAIPAFNCNMQFFDSICVAINSMDDLKTGFSNFMYELQTLKKLLEAATESKKCFGIFDEMFRGTNIDDALDITDTTLQGLKRFPDSVFIISTHLYQLNSAVKNVHTHLQTFYIEAVIEDSRPSFTYKLKNGWSDLKMGRILFEKEGLPGLLGY